MESRSEALPNHSFLKKNWGIFDRNLGTYCVSNESAASTSSIPFGVVETRSSRKSKNSGIFSKNGFLDVTFWIFFQKFPEFVHFWHDKFLEFVWFLHCVLKSICDVLCTCTLVSLNKGNLKKSKKKRKKSSSQLGEPLLAYPPPSPKPAPSQGLFWRYLRYFMYIDHSLKKSCFLISGRGLAAAARSLYS